MYDQFAPSNLPYKINKKCYFNTSIVTISYIDPILGYSCCVGSPHIRYRIGLKVVVGHFWTDSIENPPYYYYITLDITTTVKIRINIKIYKKYLKPSPRSVYYVPKTCSSQQPPTDKLSEAKVLSSAHHPSLWSTGVDCSHSKMPLDLVGFYKGGASQKVPMNFNTKQYPALKLTKMLHLKLGHLSPKRIFMTSSNQ